MEVQFTWTRSRMILWRVAMLIMASGLCGAQDDGHLCADTFEFTNESGDTQTVTGILAASGQGVHAIEQSDGSLLLIPEPSVQTRLVGVDPEPLTPREMSDRLTEEFGTATLRTMVRDPYVVGLVLAGPLPEQSELQVTAFLRNAAQFLDRVDTVFSGFSRDLRIELCPPRYPLVMLIFETDQDFNAYTTKVTGGRGLSAELVSGFYSPLTNRLAIRIGECRSFQVPLHEAIHQQVFNRGLLQRLADIPAWFNEGIATGFENNGERINIGPIKVHSTYAQRLQESSELDWHEVVTNDNAFRGDVLAGAAYAHAWGIHWSLVTRHKAAYARYLRQLGQLQPLQKQSADARRDLFEEIFKTTIPELEAEFPRLLKAAMKRQGVRFDSPPPAGYSLTTGDAGEVELTAVQRTSREGLIEVQGRLRNVSPFRDFAYYVTVQTDSGLYADWFIPSVARLQTAPLSKQFVSKPLPGGSLSDGTNFWVEIVSAPPESEAVAAWKQGDYPQPVRKPRQ